MPKKWKLGKLPPVGKDDLWAYMQDQDCLDLAILEWAGASALTCSEETTTDQVLEELASQRRRLLELVRLYLGAISPIHTDDDDAWFKLLKIAPLIVLAQEEPTKTPGSLVRAYEQGGEPDQLDDRESYLDARRLAAFADPLLHDGIDRSVIVGHAVLGGVFVPPKVKKSGMRRIEMTKAVQILDDAKRRFRRNRDYVGLHKSTWWLFRELATIVPLED